MIWRALLAMSLLILTVSATARACSCAQSPPGLCPGAWNSDAVFLGTVTEIARVSAVASVPDTPAAASNPESAAMPAIRYRFHVEEQFAGSVAAGIETFSGGDDGDCGYRFQKGEQYIVFAQQKGEGRLFVTTCSETRPAAEALALLPQLRAMRDGQRVASVFGVLRRGDPPFLSPPGNSGEPLPRVPLRLRSKYDRFQTSTDANGVYSFYDVHAGNYSLTASLPPREDMIQKDAPGAPAEFTIPTGACYEYNVEALPAGHIRGTVLGASGKPLSIASLELYRAGTYDGSRPGLWGFQGATGVFEFDHIGPGEYILVFNRQNRMDPDSPYPRAFYPGVTNRSQAKVIKVKDGHDLLNVTMKLKQPYPTRQVRVHLRWHGGSPPGEVTVEAKTDKGGNPSARKISDGLYEFTLLASARYTISAYEELQPQHDSARLPREPHARTSDDPCAMPPRIETAPVSVTGSDRAVHDVMLVFSMPSCAQPPSQPGQ